MDVENGLGLNVSSGADLLYLYQEYRTSHEKELASLCRQRCGRFVSTSSADSLKWILFDLLRRRGWLR